MIFLYEFYILFNFYPCVDNWRFYYSVKMIKNNHFVGDFIHGEKKYIIQM